MNLVGEPEHGSPKQKSWVVPC